MGKEQKMLLFVFKQRKDKFDTFGATLLNYILFQIHLFLRSARRSVTKTDVCLLMNDSRIYPTGGSRTGPASPKRTVYKIRNDFGKSTDHGVVQGESVRLESESPSIRRGRGPKKSVYRGCI